MKDWLSDYQQEQPDCPGKDSEHPEVHQADHCLLDHWLCICFEPVGYVDFLERLFLR